MGGQGVPSFRIFAVTGHSGAGKTRLLVEIARRASDAGLSCGGFVQPRGNPEQPQTREYLLTHLTDQSTLPLARRHSNHGFVFAQQAFERAEQWLRKDAVGASLLIVDEFGRLEAEGSGHARALETVLSRHPEIPVLVGVRKSALRGFCRRFGVAREQVLDLDTERDNVERFVHDLLAALRPPVASTPPKNCLSGY